MKFSKKSKFQRPVYMMGMGGRGGSGGGGGGGMGGACYVYDENQRPNDNLVTPDITFRRVVDMRIPLRMDDGRVAVVVAVPHSPQQLCV